jgi:hypothetical protein
MGRSLLRNFAMTNQVYMIKQSYDEDGERPDRVTYCDPNGEFLTHSGYARFQCNCLVSAGKAGHSIEQWFMPELYASEPGRTKIDEWDFYNCSTFGAFSPRAMEVLKPFFGERFIQLPARLEGLFYFCLRCESRINCLDKEASEIIYYEIDPTEVMLITKYVFHRELLTDPSIFAIPESLFSLYCTDAIPEIVRNAGLKGFEFQPLDRLAINWFR